MTHRRNTLLLAVLAAGASAIPAAALAAGATSHATLWQTPDGNVLCGQDAYPAADTLCSNKEVPAPPHTTSTAGDPGFVSLGKTARPTLLRESQYSFKNPSDKFVKLAAGTTWSLHGVTCTVATKSVTCKNASGHGFSTGGGKYKSF
jgi:hypothetical protein